MKKYSIVFLTGLLAGVFIGLGGAVNLAVLTIEGLDLVLSKFIGSFLFATGLFGITTFSLSLYTGKVGSIVNKDYKFLLDLLVMFLGNVLGTFLLAQLLLGTRNGGVLKELASGIIQSKYDDNWVSILLLAIGCGFLMEFAVQGFNQLKDKPSVRYISVFLGVILFILLGFEHVIANFFYLFISNNYQPLAIIYFFLMLIGNSLGGILLALPLKVYKDYLKTNS
ncbi:MAG: formate/nitrite transporter family protein [Bacillales bacterium]|jgi:formate/nitrite transporter FocA (FNT family)|nr:formate/nitrite transporter family protein [Bacillales bacterium]